MTIHGVFTLLALLLFTGLTEASAADPCSDLQAKEIRRIPLDQEAFLIACAESSTGPVSDLTVLRVQGETVEHLFDGDTAFKSYVIQKSGSSLILKEMLNTNNAKPFIETKIFCRGNKCLSTPRCLWKKAKPDEAVVLKAQAELKNKSLNLTDMQMEEIFYAAINGSAGACKIFESSSENANAGGSEAFETYKGDIARMKKLRCF